MEKRLSTKQRKAAIRRPENKVIVIKKILDSGKLSMSDKGRTEGKSRDKIIWVVAPNSGVAEITDIQPKPGFLNLLVDLGPMGNSGNVWMGTLIDVDTPAIEEYTILYKKDDGTNRQYDPIIQVNPGP